MLVFTVFLVRLESLVDIVAKIPWLQGQSLSCIYQFSRKQLDVIFSGSCPDKIGEARLAKW